MMALYKREGMSPFSGCLSSIVQIILLFSVFLLVRQPLTYMVKMDQDAISKMTQIVSSQDSNTKNAYQEIAIIQYVKNLAIQDSASENADNSGEQNNNSKNSEGENNNYSENSNSKEQNNNAEKSEQQENNAENPEDKNNNVENFDISKYADQANLNMDFFGIDLTQVPTKNPTDIKVLIIPILYVISSFISIRISMTTTKEKSNEEKKLITDGTEQEEKYNLTEDMNKTMVWLMPIMSVTIAIIAPLGLAFYWLMNNVLMIIERLVLNKYLNKEEEAETNA